MGVVEIPPAVWNAVVRLPREYHQVITNVIRQNYPFGQPVPSIDPKVWAKIVEGLAKIYAEYPVL